MFADFLKELERELMFTNKFPIFVHNMAPRS